MSLEYMAGLQKANDNKENLNRAEQLRHMQTTVHDTIMAHIKSVLMMSIYTPYTSAETLVVVTRAAMIVAIAFISSVPEPDRAKLMADMDILMDEILKKGGQ